jgi:hypothetical protein
MYERRIDLNDRELNPAEREVLERRRRGKKYERAELSNQEIIDAVSREMANTLGAPPFIAGRVR